MSVKAPRGLTHAKRLYAPGGLGCADARGWHELGSGGRCCSSSCTPVTSATTPGWTGFSARLPSWMRVVVEFRHPSWHDEGVFELLERTVPPTA